jgi:hypothetical protein
MADSQTRGTFDQIIEGCDPSIVAIAKELGDLLKASLEDRRRAAGAKAEA